MYLETSSGGYGLFNLFSFNLSRGRSSLLLSNISGSNIMKDGNLIAWENETPVSRGNVNSGQLPIGMNFNGFSYYNLSDGSTHALNTGISNANSIEWYFSNGKIVWSKVPDLTFRNLLFVNNKISIYDINSKKLETLDPSFGIKVSPLIMGNKLVWVNYGTNLIDWFFNGKYLDATIQSTLFPNF